MPATPETSETSPWWGHYEIDTGSGVYARIGPLDLTAWRNEREWRVEYQRHDGTGDNAVSWSREIRRSEHAPLLDASTTIERFAFRQPHRRLSLAPALAERPVVTRPVTPFRLPPGEQCRIYVSSPLRCELRVGDAGVKLCEVPIIRPSDTWFGASTGDGQLCYAARTEARLELADVPRRMHRAVTPLVIRNQSESSLLLERVSLPATFLSLYISSRTGLWTQEVAMTRREGEARSTVKLEDRPPAEAETAQRIAGPREIAGSNVLERAWSALFG